MDCLEGIKQIDDNSIDAVITDPPYNIGKDEWDRIDNYCDWFISVAKECNRVLKNNGTFWFFHMDFDILSKIHNKLINETSFRHKQMIIIDKGKQSIAGRTSDMLRSYPRATEYLQFYTFQDDSKGHAKVFDNLRKGLNEERKQAGLSLKQVNQLLGVATNGGGMACHYFSEGNKIWELPTKKAYLKLKSTGYFKKPYEDLRKEYEDLRKEYEDLRYPFNLQTGYTDVWKINFYKEKNNGHCTQKPLNLVRMIVRTATMKGMVVCDPFIGVGSTALACKQLERHFVGFEINHEYCQIANKRLKNIPYRLEVFDSFSQQNEHELKPELVVGS